MSTHTPIIDTAPEFKDILARHISAAMRFVNGDEKIELPVYHAQNHSLVDKLADGWLECKGDSKDCYARALCYANLGITYDVNHFDTIAELHYDKCKNYWLSAVNYIKRSLDGLL